MTFDYGSQELYDSLKTKNKLLEEQVGKLENKLRQFKHIVLLTPTISTSNLSKSQSKQGLKMKKNHNWKNQEEDRYNKTTLNKHQSLAHDDYKNTNINFLGFHKNKNK